MRVVNHCGYVWMSAVVVATTTDAFFTASQRPMRSATACAGTFVWLCARYEHILVSRYEYGRIQTRVLTPYVFF